jgi:hypothetical protein
MYYYLHVKPTPTAVDKEKVFFYYESKERIVKELPRKDIHDWKEIPLEHYTEIFKGIDAEEAAARCRTPFDGAKKAFALRLMGEEYAVFHPIFKIENAAGVDDTNISEKILVMRFLSEGKWTERAGKSLSYRETSSAGEVYFKSFEGRCIKRLVRTFGNAPDDFKRVMENTPALKAEKAGEGLAYRFEFISNLYMTMLLWPGDEEFPSSAQILFDDNVPAAFSAEDLAITGEVVVSRLKKISDKLKQG